MNPRDQQPWQQPQPPLNQPQQPPVAGQPQPAPIQQPAPPAYQPATPPQTAMPGEQLDYSVDYLNQIAAPAKPSRSNNILIWIIIGLVILAAAVFVFILATANRPTTMSRSTELYVRMDSLRSIASAQHRHLRDNSLRTTNTSYQLFLSNAIRDIEEPLQAAGITKSKLDAELRGQEKAFVDNYTAQFDEARLNIRLDQTYAREMAYQLSVLNTMMKTLYDNTSTESLRAFLEETSRNLAPISQDFAEFSTAQ